MSKLRAGQQSAHKAAQAAEQTQDPATRTQGFGLAAVAYALIELGDLYRVHRVIRGPDPLQQVIEQRGGAG